MQKNIPLNPLENIIKKLIKDNNFITLEEFINLALYHPKYGYYCNALPIGKEQDFTTSPEISQLFGEMLAFWIIEKWYTLNKPLDINLIELGPGNGTLMLDILNILKKIPKLSSSITVVLVEINNNLRIHQQKKLNNILKEFNIKTIWVNHINEINYISSINALAPNIIIANEFLDALPTKQFKHINNKWHEVIITLYNKEFFLALNKTPCNINLILANHIKCKENMIFEYSPKTLTYMYDIITLISKSKGYAVIIDYGYLDNKFTNTIQSISKHKVSSFLENVGEQDITYLVNFPLILQQLQKLQISYKITTQNNFLLNLGIKQRTNKLLENANKSQKHAILSGVERILDNNNMGSIFKVLEINYT